MFHAATVSFLAYAGGVLQTLLSRTTLGLLVSSAPTARNQHEILILLQALKQCIAVATRLWIQALSVSPHVVGTGSRIHTPSRSLPLPCNARRSGRLQPRAFHHIARGCTLGGLQKTRILCFSSLRIRWDIDRVGSGNLPCMDGMVGRVEINANSYSVTSTDYVWGIPFTYAHGRARIRSDVRYNIKDFYIAPV